VLTLQSFRAAGQPDWRWWNKCQGLFFGETPARSAPPGEHSEQGSGDYKVRGNPVPGELGWFWCSKCQGLFYGEIPGSHCRPEVSTTSREAGSTASSSERAPRMGAEL
jgi:hypothetical protein